MVLKNAPTAQAWPELGSAAAAFRMFSLALGLGLETTLQAVPFHCSITVVVVPVLGSTKSPTAQMSLAETMAMPWSSPAAGLETTLQLVPFHCSMRV